MTGEELTRQEFGDYVSIYNFSDAIGNFYPFAKLLGHDGFQRNGGAFRRRCATWLQRDACG